MVISVPTPGDLIGWTKSTAGWAAGSAASAAALPARVVGIVSDVENLLERVNRTVGSVDELMQRTAKVVEETDDLLARTRGIVESANETVESAARVAHSAQHVVATADDITTKASNAVAKAERSTEAADGLLAAYEPAARRAAPMLDRFVGELSQEEVTAAIRLVDQLPTLTEHVLSDILPILRTLDRVGPEIHELLEVTHDLRRAIVGIPGFKYFRRRGEDRVTGEELDPGEGNHFGPRPETPDEVG